MAPGVTFASGRQVRCIYQTAPVVAVITAHVSAFTRGRRANLSASVDVDLLGAGAALDVAAPVVLTVTAVTHLDSLDCVTPTATHRSTAT